MAGESELVDHWAQELGVADLLDRLLVEIEGIN